MAIEELRLPSVERDLREHRGNAAAVTEQRVQEGGARMSLTDQRRVQREVELEANAVVAEGADGESYQADGAHSE